MMTNYLRASKSVHVSFIQEVINRLCDHEEWECVCSLVERVHFLTEGYKEKDPRHPGTRMREIMKHFPAQ
jgi:hypothetical protein